MPFCQRLIITSLNFAAIIETEGYNLKVSMLKEMSSRVSMSVVGIIRLTFILVFLCALITLSMSSGRFELRILNYKNFRGELANGFCCRKTRVPEPKYIFTATVVDGKSDQRHTPNSRQNVCSGPCNVYFRVCLREHLTRIVSDGACTFGNVTNAAQLGAVFEFSKEYENSLFILPFDFAWRMSSFS